MNILFLILLCGLPFSAFFLNKVDMWSAHGFFFQGVLLIIFCCSLFNKPKRDIATNKPLGIFSLWVCLLFFYYYFQIFIAVKQYPIVLILPFFNFLCFLLFYKLSIEYLSKEDIERIYKYLSYGVFIVICYSILQILNLDQFYTAVYKGAGQSLGHIGDDDVVGVIGNPSHFAGYLAICQPLFFRKKLLNYIALGLLWFVILYIRSATGIMAGLGVLLFWLILKKKYKVAILITILILIPCVLYKDRIIEIFSPAGRIGLWKILWQKFRAKPITGSGLGIMRIWKIQQEGGLWIHAHCDYFEVLLTLGIVGFAGLVWCIIDFFKRFIKSLKNDLIIQTTSIFIGFLLVGLTLYPAHLWLTASMGMMAYSNLYILTNKEQE